MNRALHGSLWFALIAPAAFAQQSGTLAGRVTGADGHPLAGVRVQASSPVLPAPRTILTGPDGRWRLPFLPPGAYEVLFRHPSGLAERRSTEVLLQQTTTLDLAVRTPGALVEVVGQASQAIICELRTTLATGQVDALPLAKDYRALVTLIPAVPYTQETVRGPAAGGSGQDNVHMFDGVNVNLPFYGTVTTEPSTQDVDQVSVNKGGGTAVGFNRAAGYSMDTVSKSGTSRFAGELGYEAQPASLIARHTGIATFDASQTYTHGNVGGPLVPDLAYFFYSFYRPTVRRENSANVYGPMPDFTNDRTEHFGKLTFAPGPDLLVHLSRRESARTYHNQPPASLTSAPSTSDGGRITQGLTALEATWAARPGSFFTFRFNDFAFRTSDRPDLAATALPVPGPGAILDLADLTTQGQFAVPRPVAGATAYNAAIAPYIERYGYLDGGVAQGGGAVGGYPFTADQNFFRRTWQIGWDLSLGGAVSHDLHAGWQWNREYEDLVRRSNGWGVITMPNAVTTPNTRQPATFVAALQQQGLGVPPIHSEMVSQNLEVNDRIRWRRFTFNVGAMVSRDRLYGQGLRETPGTASGYTVAPGARYLEHEIPFRQTLQPRLGAAWAYRGEDTVYAAYARYVPATSSLPRGASWARNSAATVSVYFDAQGRYLDQATLPSSTGKLFVPGIRPRHTDEYLVGATFTPAPGLAGRIYGRYRYSCNFWEDTRNDARVRFNPPAGVPATLYLPDLSVRLTQLGVTLDKTYPDNQYVIAQLDGAFTRYYQAALELTWRHARGFLSGSYAWSHYYGTYDQDNTTTGAANDNNIFVGSSNLADDAGRQMWDFKYGNLTGDRRHVVKLFGAYTLPWRAQVGAFAVYQSGQPWQYSSYLPYLNLINASGPTSRSDSNRYVEPAGCRRTPPHYQLDLNYAQTLWQDRRLKLSAAVDLFNVFNRQTGYDLQTGLNGSYPGTPQATFAPRRTRLGLTFQF